MTRATGALISGTHSATNPSRRADLQGSRVGWRLETGGQAQIGRGIPMQPSRLRGEPFGN
jgi:hypothetical protein